MGLAKNDGEKIIGRNFVVPGTIGHVVPIGQSVIAVKLAYSSGTPTVGDTYECKVTQNAATGAVGLSAVTAVTTAATVSMTFTVTLIVGKPPVGGRIRFVCTYAGTSGASYADAEYRIDTYGFGACSTFRSGNTAAQCATGTGNFGRDASGAAIAANGRATVLANNTAITFLVVEPIAKEDEILSGFVIDQLTSGSGIWKPIFTGTDIGIEIVSPTAQACMLTIVDGYGVTGDGTVVTTNDYVSFLYRDVSAG